MAHMNEDRAAFLTVQAMAVFWQQEEQQNVNS